MSNSIANVTKINKVLLILVIIGFLIGIGLLVLARYMLTNYAYSLAQNHRSHVVNFSGKIVLALSLDSADSLCYQTTLEQKTY